MYRTRRCHRFVVRVSVASLFLTSMSYSASGSPTSTEVIGAWAERAEAHALRVKEANDQYKVWRLIAEFHAGRGSLAQARNAARQINHVGFRARCLEWVALTFAEVGDLKSAVGIAKSLKRPRDRNEVLLLIASVASDQHDFAGATATVELIDNIWIQDEIWYEFARSQASAGQYDWALKTAKRYRGLEFGGEEMKAELLEFIAEAKRTGRREARTKRERPKKIGHVIRDFGASSFVAPTEEALARFRDLAGRLSDPGFLAWNRYRDARAYHKRNDILSCRAAIRSALKATREVRDLYQRLLYSMLIADLLLELGDKDQARQVAQKTLTPETTAAAFKTPDQAGLGPKIVAVLVRLGAVERAFETARLSEEAYHSETWWALGACCALEGRVPEVKQRLEHIKSEKYKALLCIGVAAGLQELQKREPNPFPLPESRGPDHRPAPTTPNP